MRAGIGSSNGCGREWSVGEAIEVARDPPVAILVALVDIHVPVRAHVAGESPAVHGASPVGHFGVALGVIDVDAEDLESPKWNGGDGAAKRDLDWVRRDLLDRPTRGAIGGTVVLHGRPHFRPLVGAGDFRRVESSVVRRPGNGQRPRLKPAAEIADDASALDRWLDGEGEWREGDASSCVENGAAGAEDRVHEDSPVPRAFSLFFLEMSNGLVSTDFEKF